MENQDRIIQKREIFNLLLSYFKNNTLDLSNENNINEIRQILTAILQLELEELGFTINPNISDGSPIQILITNDPNDTRHAYLEYPRKIDNKGNLIQIPPSITLNEFNLYHNLDNPNVDIRTFAVKQLIQTLLHELRHLEQHLTITYFVNSKDSLMYAKDYALQGVLGKPFVEDNYFSFFIENDADESAYYKYLEIMGEDDDIRNLQKIEAGKKILGQYCAKISNNNFEYDIELKEKDEVTTEILDDLICNKKIVDLIFLFPILQKEYNYDCTRKTPIQLVENMNYEINILMNNPNISGQLKQETLVNLQHMYFELIYKSIRRASSSEFNELILKSGDKNIIKLLNLIDTYFKNDMLKTQSILEQMDSALEVTRFNLPVQSRSQIKAGRALSYTDYQNKKNFIEATKNKIQTYDFPSAPSGNGPSDR